MKIIRCNYVFISKKVNINFLKISVISIILNLNKKFKINRFIYGLCLLRIYNDTTFII